jgi:hypothetical protein
MQLSRLLMQRLRFRPSAAARTALYYGLVPALLYGYCQRGDDVNVASCKSCIAQCFDHNLVSDGSIERLLSNFFTGSKYTIPDPLLVLLAFDELFERFLYAKDKSVDAWEALFVVALLMRVVSGDFDKMILPIRTYSSFEKYSYSYNDYIHHSSNDAVTVDQYISFFNKPVSVPHVAVYYPGRSSSPTYDVIVAVYDRNWERVLYGYQLKEGAKTPAATGTLARSEMFHRSVWVRGQAAKIGSSSSSSSSGTGWKVPSTEDIETFFGVSGRHWTPAAWKSLSESEATSSTDSTSKSSKRKADSPSKSSKRMADSPSKSSKRMG